MPLTGPESLFGAPSGLSAYAVVMDRASKERLVAVLSPHDVSTPHVKANGRPCWCRLEAERIIRDIEAAGFEIKDKRRGGAVEINIQFNENVGRHCPNCGHPVPA